MRGCKLRLHGHKVRTPRVAVNLEHRFPAVDRGTSCWGGCSKNGRQPKTADGGWAKETLGALTSSSAPLGSHVPTRTSAFPGACGMWPIPSKQRRGERQRRESRGLLPPPVGTVSVRRESADSAEAMQSANTPARNRFTGLGVAEFASVAMCASKAASSAGQSTWARGRSAWRSGSTKASVSRKSASTRQEKSMRVHSARSGCVSAGGGGIATSMAVGGACSLAAVRHSRFLRR
jgi:hypothetical protein